MSEQVYDGKEVSTSDEELNFDETLEACCREVLEVEIASVRNFNLLKTDTENAVSEEIDLDSCDFEPYCFEPTAQQS